MSGISRSRLLIRASGKMCRRTIQSEFLTWIKGNAGEQRGKVLKLQKALEPFSCVKPRYVTKPPETNGVPCSKGLHYGKKIPSSRLYKWKNSQQSSLDFCLQIHSRFFNYFILLCTFWHYPALLGTVLTQESKISSFRNSGSKFLVQTILMSDGRFLPWFQQAVCQIQKHRATHEAWLERE